MNVLVTGSKGQLGSDVVERCIEIGADVVCHDRNKADITNESEIKEYIRNCGADVVIHCAAYTEVDKAEDERELCYNVNVKGTRYIAEVCNELGIKMIYLSTDYVFDGKGDSPWRVEDKPNPVNYYGWSKYMGELEVLNKLENFFIVRISWVFGKNGKNFIKTMIKLATQVDAAAGEIRDCINVVADQIGSPTYTHDLAELLCEMVQTEKYGIYHATNEGYCSWYDFACKIFEFKKIDISVNPIFSSQYKTKAVRPLNSRLDKSSLPLNGFKRLQNWDNALSDYLRLFGTTKENEV